MLDHSAGHLQISIPAGLNAEAAGYSVGQKVNYTGAFVAPPPALCSANFTHPEIPHMSGRMLLPLWDWAQRARWGVPITAGGHLIER